MNANTLLEATHPAHDASVHASAGTGKTWLLVTRVVRLLLSGASPDGILAVTFTRKAAAEMEQRIMERLHTLATADQPALENQLAGAGIDINPDNMQRAPQLYETLLCNPRRLRCTTFHALCQELLQRFPLEAGVPPGFEVIEKTGQLEQAAYDALLAVTARAPADPVSVALDALVAGCGGLPNTRQALHAFIAQRSDWWAWAQGETDAGRQLADFLDINPGQNPLADYPDDSQRARHQAFADLLKTNTTKTNSRNAALIDSACHDGLAGADYLAAITPAFLKIDGQPLKRVAGKTQAGRLGADNEQRFLLLHAEIAAELMERHDCVARHTRYAITTAWYRAGSALLDHYQRIKREQRVFDFADLEWLACELLNRSEHASWVQYKLDARIDHLLIDEFQDTNPTQWRMLLPLLEEMAAGSDARQRSVFVVGDRKQSIYSFRRANPALLNTAADWISEKRGGQAYPLNSSRRSARAIMDCVNAVFTQAATTGLLAEFSPHDTHLPDVYGQVMLLPLSTGESVADSDDAAITQLRNPLIEPRILDEDTRHRREGEQIAAQIRQLVDTGATVEKDGSVRTLGYGDIMILLRQRTHADAYEAALRDAGIPCLGASRGLLLENLEVRDLVALLNCLISPYDNLALAQVLRSPLFGLDSEQLLALPGDDSEHWYAHLQQLAAAGESPWCEIFGMLQGWRALAGQLPVHDLLDRIFHEGEVFQRYESAFPAPLLPRVRASLTRFIELALELDNGRYPSLPRFMDLLYRLRQSDQDQPDESSPDDTQGDRVRLLTVHAAKGLEAPVIFLADSATPPRDRHAYNAITDWPSGAEQPSVMLLAGKAAQRDSRTNALLQQQAVAARCEDANLLYVALTRARQYLFISGSAKPAARETGWYGLVEQAMTSCERSSDGYPCFKSGTRKAAGATVTASETGIDIPAGLTRPITTAPAARLIAPSRHSLSTQSGYTDTDGRARGIAIHLMLDHLTRAASVAPDTQLRQVAATLERSQDDGELQAWWAEAVAVTRHDRCKALFDPDCYQQAWNEVPVQYLDGNHMVHGIIDRLLVSDGEVTIIDYKTHQLADRRSLNELAENYRTQMRYYNAAVTRLWPNHTVRAALLFTAGPELVWLDGLQSAVKTD